MDELYFEEDYADTDYAGGDILAIDALPPVPNRGDAPEIFIEKSNAFLAALTLFAIQMDAAAVAMSNNATNSLSYTNLTIGTGDKTFVAELSKSYVVGMTVRAASTLSPANWMQGDVLAYNSGTGSLTIGITATQGSGTFADWTLSLSAPASTGGSLTQDFSVKSLTHAIGAAIASASTIDLSSVTGNFTHVTGNTGINAATMTQGKDVWVIFDGTPILGYHATNHKLNSGGVNVTAAAGDIALYTYDGTTVRVALFKANGKAIVETAAPASAAVGSGLFHFGSTAPANYLVCPTTPTNVSRTTYATLFAAIGTTWGGGDGSTTFGLPWLAPNYALLQASSNVGSATVGANLAHSHTMPANMGGNPGGSIAYAGNTGSYTWGESTGSSGGAANLAAGSRVLICVRYQ